MKKEINRGTAMLMIFIAGFFWSTGGLLVKIVSENPVTLAGCRSLFSLPVFFLAYPWKTIRHKFNKRVWFYGMFPCLLSFSYVISARLTTAANAIMLQFASPIYIVILCYVIYKEVPKKEDIIVVISSVLGIVLFFMDGLSGGNIIGNIVAMIGGLFFAMYYTFLGRSGEEPACIIIAAQIETVVISLPWLLFIAPLTLEVKPVLVALAMGLVQRGAGEAIYAKAAGHCSPLDAVLMSMTEPLLNPIWVLLFYGERPGIFALIGSGVVVVSVVGWNVYKIKHRQPESDNSECKNDASGAIQ